jgi:hypothetical protein
MSEVSDECDVIPEGEMMVEEIFIFAMPVDNGVESGEVTRSLAISRNLKLEVFVGREMDEDNGNSGVSQIF